ncbi:MULTISPECIES: hypothetical protein [Pseudomonas]|uniref:Phage protein n=1 Tax=Pseudomonas putida TaxID=303 RepID=A0AAW5HMD3_PSEPU|nr:MULTISPECIES: hypothetical protein [Pseudomonas]WHH51059.1 hypothetical protein QFA96_26275 [Pseudomonas sp. Ap32]MBP2273873.1 hydroxymethylglutaryl-CoA reductase [Pseudomonas sp. BP6]MBP2287156.1 hydroxymethylglutaryl-CoA reductase [Pseudomonas sp. BP7]MCO1623235.1 hypothetical protein [Pseudomonas putida]NVN63838.1 hypothetical protein [Pseudomonas putida]
MKHFYLVTLYGYTDDGRVYYPTGFAGCDEQRITKADIAAVIEKGKQHGHLRLHSISYLGHMTEDAFEHLRSMSDE